MSGVLSGGHLGGPIVVIPIHREPRFGNTVDDGSGIGIRRDEAIEVGLSEFARPPAALSGQRGFRKAVDFIPRQPIGIAPNI
jgi:hypothetical protein